MQKYDWSCSACGSSNLATMDHCTVCACPASATALQIGRARERIDLPNERSHSFGTVGARDNLVIQALAVLLLFAGWLLASYAAPLIIFALGLLAAVVGTILWRRSKKPPSA